MQEQLLQDVGLALARGNVALWVGPDWRPPTTAGDLDLIIGPDWLGVWSESTSGVFAEALADHRQKQMTSRLVIEVPDRITDVLGERFSLAEICPFFYLNGTEQTRLSDRNRRVARDTKVDCLTRLGASVLLIAGYQGLAELETLVLGEIAEAAPQLELVVLGIKEPSAETLRSKLSESLEHRVHTLAFSLSQVLRTVATRKLAAPAEPQIRIGSETVELRQLLREPPIDRDFLLLTEQDVRAPEHDEPVQQIFSDMLAGREAPWRALAHGLAWQRDFPHRRQVKDWLKELRHGGADLQVLCLNVPAEFGSGLTMLLKQIAFDCAQAGYPTLMHRSSAGGLNYDLVRTFLTDLYRDLPTEGQHFPAVLIFDAPFVENDVQGILRDIAVRLVRDSRRVLMIRGIPVQHLQLLDDQFRGSHSVRKRTGVREEWLQGLSAALDTGEQRKLAEWAQTSLQRLGITLPTVSEWILNWDQAKENVPLLICLYFILTAELRSAAQLGQRVVSRLKKILTTTSGHSESENAGGADRVLTGAELRAAMSPLLEQGLGWNRVDSQAFDNDDVCAVFVCLAALGWLRVGTPRTVLAGVTRISPEKVHLLVAKLEEFDLATTSLPLALPSTRSRPDAPIAPLAWYGGEENVGLRHPAYGRLVLEWLNSVEGEADRKLLAAGGLTERVLCRLENAEHLDDYPLSLLEPVLRSLRPVRAHVDFAAELSVRFLRLRKEKQPHVGFSHWQWRHAELLLEAFDWLDEQVVRQSSVILHSRGITRYKATHPDLPPEQYRQRYQEAERDLQRALELAEGSGSEHPSHILTSLGLLYFGWMSREREDGHEKEWRALDRKVEEALRRSLSVRPDNTYAIYGLAKYLVNRYRRRRELGDEIGAAALDLADALELLQAEPEAYFSDEWSELKTQAIQLLDAPDAGGVIKDLKARRDELGYALDALRALAGRIPTEPTIEESEVQEMGDASRILESARTVSPLKRCNLAQLLRYALFSADPERITKPAFQTRFDLLTELVGTIYMDRPMWRFDYAMLAFQVGQYDDGAEAFAWLRRGQRYFEVPLERSQFLVKSPDSLEARGVLLRVVSSGGADEKGWGRVEHPRFRDPVPFSVRAFRSRAKSTQPGTTPTCFIRLRPSGPFAEPEAR